MLLRLKNFVDETWFSAFAEMTGEDAGMTVDDSGMTGEEGGMTGKHLSSFPRRWDKIVRNNFELPKAGP